MYCCTESDKEKNTEELNKILSNNRFEYRECKELRLIYGRGLPGSNEMFLL